jgi:hypothetical protein
MSISLKKERDKMNPMSWNRYAYCLNNPYKYVDPDGEIPFPFLVPLAFIAIKALGIGRDC